VRAQMHGAMAAGGASIATPTGPWSAAGALPSIPPPPAGPPAGGGGTPPAPPTSAPVSGADARTQAREALARAEALLPGLAPGAIGVRRRRALSRQGRPSAGDLTRLGDQLRAALSAGMPDSDLRHHVRHALALVLAELHWTGATSGNARHLAETVRTLEEVSSVGDRRGPTVRHAELLDVLARCYHEQARLGHQPTGSPVRTVRAALRELGRSVLLARTSDEALDLASLAGDIVHRTVSWCLADGDPRRAVEIAEAGRALVLASAVLGGRVADLLRELNRPDLAESWSLAGSAGDVDVGAGERTRLAALEVLSREPLGLMSLVPPRVDDVMTAAVAAGLDAVVMLVPPAPSEGLGPDETPPPPDLAHAILVRSTGDVDVVRLEGLRVGSGSALGEYVEALEALLELDDATRDELIEASLSGFGYRGTSRGRLWLAALDRLGAEAYEVVVRPLIEHIDRWGLGHLPHIALVPLDVLGAVPYAAAWRRDTDLPGGRRYAVHDLVLSMAASARLLARASARPRRRLNESVVFVSDPDGTLPLAGIAAEAVVDALYPEARRYGVGAPDGPATAETVLAALLGGADGIPASLLHLGTHAESTDAGTSSALALQEDEKLPLPRLLATATSRRPDAPGGLVVCDACVTDTIRHSHDESLTLATTFLAAGAKGTIGTRWPVDDDAAAVMTYLLHAELLRQPTAAHALRAAQLAMLEDRPLPEKMPEELSMTTYPGRMTEPASWAAYTFHGA